ncbi:MAG TPA: hypothetical protein PKJ62_01485 [Bacteroidia bacterium]|nr:hypothetical protein [Bacteroidia bacterium]HNS13469.1 hypothetical protein [Bacteroidia bacterium]
MKRIALLLISSFVFVAFACTENTSENQATDEAGIEEPQTTIDTPAVQTLSEEGEVNDPGIIQENIPPVTVPVNTAPAGSQTFSSGALNPAHGEPGHDCSIAVGAPLNSAKSDAGQTIQMTNPVQNNSVPAQNNVVPAQGPAVINPASPAPIMATPSNNASPAGTSGKVNPPHGEPGHDCAKPVGAPL